MAKFLEGGQENDFNNQQGIAKRKSFPSHFAEGVLENGVVCLRVYLQNGN